MFRVVTPAHKRLSLSGILISKNYIYHSGHTQKYLQKQGRTMYHQLFASISSGSGRRFSIWLLVVNFNFVFSIGHLYRAGQAMNSLPSQILNVVRQLNKHSV